ncbi:MAG: hypothetical protein AB8B99_16230 [Phormidesmis sp.]
MKVTGTVAWIEMGSGTWGLQGDDGKTYELYGDKAAALNTEGQKVSITGKIREDVMTMAMIGPVLEVDSFEVVD